MRFAIIGASAGLGRALAERLASDGHELLLVSRDQRDLDAQASDLALRFSVKVIALAGDLASAEPLARRMHDLLKTSGGCHGLLFPVGFSSDDDTAMGNPAASRRLLDVNFHGISVIVGELLPLFLSCDGRVIVGFGSVAATRGRGVNVIYSAAKRALQSYFESLRHVLGGHGIIVQFYIPGYLDTGQTYGRSLKLPMASPVAFADRVVRRLPVDFGTAYFPWWWAPICAVVRLMPWALIRRLQLRTDQ